MTTKAPVEHTKKAVATKAPAATKKPNATIKKPNATTDEGTENAEVLCLTSPKDAAADANKKESVLADARARNKKLEASMSNLNKQLTGQTQVLHQARRERDMYRKYLDENKQFSDSSNDFGGCFEELSMRLNEAHSQLITSKTQSDSEVVNHLLALNVSITKMFQAGVMTLMRGAGAMQYQAGLIASGANDTIRSANNTATTTTTAVMDYMRDIAGLLADEYQPVHDRVNDIDRQVKEYNRQMEAIDRQLKDMARDQHSSTMLLAYIENNLGLEPRSSGTPLADPTPPPPAAPQTSNAGGGGKRPNPNQPQGQPGSKKKKRVNVTACRRANNGLSGLAEQIVRNEFKTRLQKNQPFVCAAPDCAKTRSLENTDEAARSQVLMKFSCLYCLNTFCSDQHRQEHIEKSGCAQFSGFSDAYNANTPDGGKFTIFK